MKVFLIAGEPSGDALGGALMAGLKELVPDVQFDGIGGPLMAAEGLQSRFDMSELSLMGLVEILPKYFHLKRRIRETAQAVLGEQPDVLVTIDAPDFSLRVAKAVKAGGNIRCVHYVAPTVWAWRAGRAEKMAGMIDQVLALFPFEPPYMEAAGMRCDFVGHPIATQAQASNDEAQVFRKQRADKADPMVLVLPGSRRSEVSRLGPVFGQALAELKKTHPNMQAVLPAAPSVAQLVKETVADWPLPVTVLDGGIPNAPETKLAAFRAADVALAASGTVSLELAAARTPMVIAYDMAWLTRQIMSRMLLVDTVTLVNLVSDTRVVPEFIGADCVPEKIASGLRSVLEDPQAQIGAMEATMARLGEGRVAPGLRAARAVLDGLGRV